MVWIIIRLILKLIWLVGAMLTGLVRLVGRVWVVIVFNYFLGTLLFHGKQSTIALSTCEAEYISATYALQEGLFLRKLLKDLLSVDLKIKLNVDNNGAICLAKNPVQHQRSKHIDIRYHFIRNFVQEGTVVLNHVESSLNYADVFTKPAKKCNIRYFWIWK